MIWSPIPIEEISLHFHVCLNKISKYNISMESWAASYMEITSWQYSFPSTLNRSLLLALIISGEVHVKAFRSQLNMTKYVCIFNKRITLSTASFWHSVKYMENKQIHVLYLWSAGDFFFLIFLLLLFAFLSRV